MRWLREQLPEGASSPEIDAMARRLVEAVRARRSRATGVDALMHEFSLSSEEGVALMCLAEALLRIPDAATADRLIADKIGKGDWRRHVGDSPSLFVNAAAWGLLITGKLVQTGSEHGLGAALTRLIARGGEPLVRKGMDLAMRMLGNQFVTGRGIAEALQNSRERAARGYRFSYDMLGEAALTEEDAAAYLAAYEHAIHAIGREAAGRGIHAAPGISIKLSALHPRYARAQRVRVMAELLPRLKRLAILAAGYGIGMNIDAEEADRLELSLDLLEALAFAPELEGFDGIGFVAQAYQKRCPQVIDWLADLAARSGRRFMVRLVKGAYWDAEIKRAQVDGMPDYPVYTRKAHTDMSYLVCARKLLAHAGALYPQFATHNAHTVAAIHAWARECGVRHEFQCLHGMGETLYDQLVSPAPAGGERVACRIYAPVGPHQTLLAYLVRRLLENGANTSFVNRIVDPAIPVAALVADPFETARPAGGEPHPAIPLPARLFGAARTNSAGLDLSDEEVLRRLDEELAHWGRHAWHAAPLLAIDAAPAPAVREIRNPADRRDLVGDVAEADEAAVGQALAAAANAAAPWHHAGAAERAEILMRAADLFETHRTELMALAVREAGKSLPNAVAEVREAVDFLRYYASEARRNAGGTALGPVVCISPWNFPLAIFTGQAAAALAAGNAVLAKPAEQTPLIAARAVQLLHEAGVPRAVLQLLPGGGEAVGAPLVADARVAGVAFTGSTEVAQSINRVLARRAAEEGRELALVAETGGQNAMIVDSSALPEQVVQDAIASAFDSAGQRCSALRVLCLQEEVAERMLAMLRGAMAELRVGSPDRLSADVGPVIDEDARSGLLDHIESMRARGKPVFQLPLAPGCELGTFVAPTLIGIDSLAELEREVFGPVLHVLRYRREDLPRLVDDINSTGYGLTLGIHTRIDETIDAIRARARVGNIYVNRNIVGAVVGVQPFGGEGKSGTGPKAGGPLTLHRLQRGSDPDARSLQARPEAPDHPGQAPLALLEKWAGARGDEALAALARDYARASLCGAAIGLPGPTGESNRLAFVPRGTVLCVAGDAQALLNQLAAAWACGNAVAVDPETASLFPSDFPQALRDRIGLLAGSGDPALALHLALLEGARASQARMALAEREGMIVPAIDTAGRARIPLWRLVAERALCVNTTAAGGNASLMAMEE